MSARLRLSQEDLDHLREIDARLRPSTRNAVVPRAALAALLADYTVLRRVLENGASLRYDEISMTTEDLL